MLEKMKTALEGIDIRIDEPLRKYTYTDMTWAASAAEPSVTMLP